MNKISPVKRSKKEARKYYNSISNIYDWITASEKKFFRKGVEILSVSPGERILEVGCGTGRALAMISKELSSSGSLVGLDLSHQMLLESQQKNQSQTPAPYFIQGDGVNLPIKNNFFDAVFLSFTLELFSIEEMQVVLRQIKHVLLPDGRLLVIAMAKEPYNLPVRLYELAHQLFPVALDCRPIPLPDLLADNGFVIREKTKRMNWGLAIDIVLCEPMR